MDRERFDRMTRVIVWQRTRRTLAGALGAVVLALPGLSLAKTMRRRAT